ncbi:MAG: AbrB/MazE/SpoVT family DNA-binding domain-containing protein [Burkholderiales bacterium]
MKRDIPIDQAGRIVLPSEVRRRLNLGPGSRLRVAVIAERIELTPEPEPDPTLVSAPSKRKVLQVTGTDFNAAAATRAERDARARRTRR